MRKLLTVITAAISITACNRVPDTVIQPEQMAQLMADIHIGESVMELNSSNFVTDSSRMAVKQSIYMRHGVDKAKVDSSMMWYGRHIDNYMKVYDRTVEILEERLDMTGKVLAEGGMTVAGDSADIWIYPRYMAMNSRMPSEFVTFHARRDANWEVGDCYTWRAKVVNNPGMARWTIAIDYSDGTTEIVSDIISGDGWKELLMPTDSTRTALSVYGTLHVPSRKSHTTKLDSISLVRSRVNPTNYARRYSVARYNPNDADHPADSVKPGQQSPDITTNSASAPIRR